MKYSKVLTDEFTQFYQQFNILTEEALKEEDKQNQNQNQISSPKKIVIDNMTVKQILNTNRNNLDKLKRKNEETSKTIKFYEGQLKKMFEN